MSLLGHIIVKDVRRLGWLLIVPVILAALRVWMLASGLQFPGVNPARGVAFGALSLLLPFLEIIVFWLFVSLLVHEEPVVGSNAFWLTRPINRGALLAAKLITACAVLVVFPALVNAALLAVWGSPPSSVIAATIQLAIIRLAWLAAAFVVASLTPSTSAYIVATVGTLVAIGAGSVIMIALLTAWRTRGGISPRVAPAPPVPDDTGWIAVYLGIAGTGLGVLAYQYVTRRRWITLAAAVLAFGICLLTLPRIPWRFAQGIEPTPPNGVAALEPRLIELSARPTTLNPLGRGEPGFTVTAKVDVMLPRGFSAAIYAPETRLRPERGDPIIGVDGAPTMRMRTTELWPVMSSWYGLMESTPVANPWNSLASQLEPVLMFATTSEYGRLASSDLDYDGTIDVRLTEHRVAGVLPLAEGTSVRTDDYLLEIMTVQLRPGACTLIVRESHFPHLRPVPSASLAILLRNTKQKSSLLGNARVEMPMIPLTAFGVFLPRAALYTPAAYTWLTNWTTTYSSTIGSGDPVAPLVLNEAWLREADIVVIESRYAGRLIKGWTVDGLRLSSGDASR